MKICIVAEGSYPYAVGGVSSWVDGLIKTFPENQFIILSVISDRSVSGKFKYKLPDNVIEIYESYLSDFDWGTKPKTGRRTRLSRKEHAALKSLVLNDNIDWDTVFTMFSKNKNSVDDLLMGADFLDICKDCYRVKYSQIVFTDFLWTMRSIYLPMFLLLSTRIPKADVYHCVATGYAGLLGCKAKNQFGCSLVVSEHGIYTREREEEILRSDWVQGIYKSIWIDQSHKMSQVAYKKADIVTCLYKRAGDLQQELGCDKEKIQVTPNGIDVAAFRNLPGPGEEDEGYINIGAVLRVTPIKDVKTMIRAFYYAKEKVPAIRLWIMGPKEEDPVYAAECEKLVEDMGIKDIIFTGRVNVREYLGRMQFTILTSISEGQPLTILESYAAGKPVISTDVGCCRELIYGEEDDFGASGIITHIMNVPELTEAIVTMATSPELVAGMGEIGYKRLQFKYTKEKMMETYREIYQRVFYKYDI